MNKCKYYLLVMLFLFSSCESEENQNARKIKEEKSRILLAEKQRVRNKYIGNTLPTGSTPYAYCFGQNKPCSEYECSKISVKTPLNSDVVVTIKNNGVVYRHAYISAGSRYTFEFPNGTYQAFFYYGKGWNPNKFMKEASCGALNGGFIESEQFSKDDRQVLNSSILSYELILQQNGNFRTKQSNSGEAF